MLSGGLSGHLTRAGVRCRAAVGPSLPHASRYLPGRASGRVQPPGAWRDPAGLMEQPGIASSSLHGLGIGLSSHLEVGASLAQPAGADADAESDTVMTTFKWPAALGGKEVALVGSFNGWSAPLPLGRSTASGDWVRSIALPPGPVQFKFVVDGKWAVSPCEQATADDRGLYNNHRHAPREGAAGLA